MSLHILKLLKFALVILFLILITKGPLQKFCEGGNTVVTSEIPLNKLELPIINLLFVNVRRNEKNILELAKEYQNEDITDLKNQMWDIAPEPSEVIEKTMVLQNGLMEEIPINQSLWKRSLRGESIVGWKLSLDLEQVEELHDCQEDKKIVIVLKNWDNTTDFGQYGDHEAFFILKHSSLVSEETVVRVKNDTYKEALLNAEVSPTEFEREIICCQ